MRRLPEQTRPEYRQLRIFAIDPMLGRGGENRATVQVRFEDLSRAGRGDADGGPRLTLQGRRVEVVDCDTSGKDAVWLAPVDLDDAYIAMQHGLEPAESDPQFHQQMVYAVAMRTLEQFDRALGRVVYFRGQRRLRLVPHAFRGRNAFFHPQLRAVLFGYFRASESNPGENLPGQTIFTCLSHDIIAHEVTHAVVHRLRPYFSFATNPQVRPFHEAFADAVAVFQRLTYRDLVQTAIAACRGDLTQRTVLTDIAAQFGHGLGGGQTLRSVLQDPTTRLSSVEEEHEVGSVLVAALFEAFRTTYEQRTADLMRLATGGSALRPEGALHPDLLGRLTAECVRTAQEVLTLCIRAFDFLPPADVTFGAFLRALVTADWELNPLDEGGIRAAVIEACRRRGIYAEDSGSLAVGALVLDRADPADWRDDAGRFREWVDLAVRLGIEEQRREPLEDGKLAAEAAALGSAEVVQESLDRLATREQSEAEQEVGDIASALWKKIAGWVAGLTRRQRRLLGMKPDDQIRVAGFHPSSRVATHGAPSFGLVVQVVTYETVEVNGAAQKLPYGATLVIDVNGTLRYCVRSRRPESLKAGLAAMALRAQTNELGWPVDQGESAFAVDYRGMHQRRRS
ncbi:MAG TPA: hypothetical protein VGK67_28570 [Myxococcales bacterium]|jgi:hypothetical protein